MLELSYTKEMPNPIGANSTVLITRVKTANLGAQFMTKCLELKANVIVFTDFEEEGNAADFKQLSTDQKKRLFVVSDIDVRKEESLVAFPMKLAALDAPTEVTHVIDADAPTMGFVSVDGTVCLSKTANSKGQNAVFHALVARTVHDGAIWAVIPESDSFTSPKLSPHQQGDKGIKFVISLGVVAVLPGNPDEEPSRKDPVAKLCKEEHVAEMIARIGETEVGSNLRFVNWKGDNCDLERFTACEYHIPTITPRKTRKSRKSTNFQTETPRSKRKSRKTTNFPTQTPRSKRKSRKSTNTLGRKPRSKKKSRKSTNSQRNAVPDFYGDGDSELNDDLGLGDGENYVQPTIGTESIDKNSIVLVTKVSKSRDRLQP